jgi:hypothetical protein
LQQALKNFPFAIKIYMDVDQLTMLLFFCHRHDMGSYLSVQLGLMEEKLPQNFAEFGVV